MKKFYLCKLCVIVFGAQQRAKLSKGLSKPR